MKRGDDLYLFKRADARNYGKGGLKYAQKAEAGSEETGTWKQ